jgi:hypothetical protein
MNNLISIKESRYNLISYALKGHKLEEFGRIEVRTMSETGTRFKKMLYRIAGVNFLFPKTRTLDSSETTSNFKVQAVVTENTSDCELGFNTLVISNVDLDSIFFATVTKEDFIPLKIAHYAGFDLISEVSIPITLNASFSKNIARVSKTILGVVLDFSNNNSTLIQPSIVFSSIRPIDSRDTSHLMLIKYLVHSLFRKTHTFVTIHVAKRNMWKIAYGKRNDKNGSIRFTEIKNPKNHFQADPFVLEHNGETYLFIERIKVGSKGKIVCYKIDDSGYHFLGTVLENAEHLSFPFIFQNEESIYMIPETSQSRDIKLYKCTRIPDKWELVRTLRIDIEAVDTVVVPSKGRLFLILSEDRLNCGELSSCLQIYSLENLLSDELIPHPMNPILVDPRAGRNAGLVFFEDSIYRIAQSQGFNTYGKSVAAFRILNITREDYAEVLDEEFTTKINSFGLMGHHYSQSDNFLALDFRTKAKPPIES